MVDTGSILVLIPMNTGGLEKKTLILDQVAIFTGGDEYDIQHPVPYVLCCMGCV